MKNMTMVILLLMVTVAPGGPTMPPVVKKCVCREGAKANVWCHVCDIGFLATIKVKSADLFEWLDAHGHQIDPKSIKCASCQRALKSDSFCVKCGIGYKNGLAWVSRLTHSLAMGERTGKREIACKICREYLQRMGWCAKCNIGFVGNVRFEKRDRYDTAAKEFGRFLVANELSTKCETCALAMMSDGACRACKIRYRDGKPMPKERADAQK